MFEAMIFAVPLTFMWMIVTSSISPGGFFVGAVVGLAIVMLLRLQKNEINFRKLPDQLWALVVYTLTLFRDIWLSSVDVTKRVLNPALPMKPGILRVETQDPTENDVVAAFSAHGITITPGELVVDFDDRRAMYVHCLDVEASGQSADGAQTKRLRLLNRILGR
ncbi:MAG TPA: Na+/H+ antiporter subunit E [Phototrophicaceae bacterium]|jgi:multicomponent Na+:H+ antiporter subunit E|nr:Na+/H+ antiporter subunit E [Phototrophicaceae bacterium]